MNKPQVNKCRMFGAVNLVFENYSALVSTLSDLLLAKQKIDEGLATIDSERQVQESNITGITESKVEIRTNVITQVLMLSSAIKAYANSTNNIELKTKAEYTKSKLEKSSDPILYDIGMLMLNLANPIAEELSAFFFDSGKLSQLTNLLANYRQLIPKKRVALSTQKVSTQNIDTAIGDISDLLKNKVDVLMELFKESEPKFYGEYRNARKIINYSSKSSKPNPEPAEV